MRKNLVSIVTPCYNSAKYLYRLLDSVLMQDYPDIEMLAIDDGSTDNTKEIIESYIPKFQKRGYELTYIYQENAGQAAAVNNGLKYVRGEFLTWPDSDDYYNRKDSISTFVKKLNMLDDSYSTVCYIGTFVDEITLKDLKWKRSYNKRELLFETCLLGGDFLAVPINYMVRMKSFDAVNPSREIYTGRQAQNMQMFLPLFYSYKCLSIRESLCNIVVRSTSHSHTKKTYEQQLDDIEGYLEIKINTLNQMKNLSEEEKTKWEKQCHIRALKSKQNLAILFRCYKDACSYTKKLRCLGEKTDIKKRIKIFLLKFPELHINNKRCIVH